MKTTDINVLIEEGDHVVDRMDDDRIRQIESIHDHGDGTASVNMVDGGVMALSEIRSEDIRLDSEAYGDNEPFFSPEQKRLLDPSLFEGLALAESDEEHDAFVDACFNAQADESMML